MVEKREDKILSDIAPGGLAQSNGFRNFAQISSNEDSFKEIGCQPRSVVVECRRSPRKPVMTNTHCGKIVVAWTFMRSCVAARALRVEDNT